MLRYINNLSMVLKRCALLIRRESTGAADGSWNRWRRLEALGRDFGIFAVHKKTVWETLKIKYFIISCRSHSAGVPYKTYCSRHTGAEDEFPRGGRGSLKPSVYCSTTREVHRSNSAQLELSNPQELVFRPPHTSERLDNPVWFSLTPPPNSEVIFFLCFPSLLSSSVFCDPT